MNRPIFCFVGMSGSGKSTLVYKVMKYFSRFSDRYYKNLVYHTTRKKRTGEKDGVDYIFEKAIYKDDLPDIVELREYEKADEGIVYYYTTYDDVSDEEVDAYICAASVNQVLEYIKKLDDVYIIVLECPVRDRILRSLERSTTDSAAIEVCRRVLEERNEFEKVYDIDNIIIVDNSNGTDLDTNIVKIAHYIEDTLEEHI